jgi:serine phosphatase RsbU (regulator of sigma subunit)
MAFIHNGGIERGTTLRGLISDPLFNSLEGEGDSEQYFAAIITNLQSNGGDLVGAYQKFLTDVQEVRYSSLNAFLLTSDHLFIVAAFKPENRPPSQPADYYDLSWRSENGIFSAWSSGVRSGVGTPVANYSLMQVERATGEVTTRPLR